MKKNIKVKSRIPKNKQKQKQRQSVNVKVHIDQSKKNTGRRTTYPNNRTSFQMPAIMINPPSMPSIVQSNPFNMSDLKDIIQSTMAQSIPKVHKIIDTPNKNFYNDLVNKFDVTESKLPQSIKTTYVMPDEDKEFNESMNMLVEDGPSRILSNQRNTKMNYIKYTDDNHIMKEKGLMGLEDFNSKIIEFDDIIKRQNERNLMDNEDFFSSMANYGSKTKVHKNSLPPRNKNSFLAFDIGEPETKPIKKNIDVFYPFEIGEPNTTPIHKDKMPTHDNIKKHNYSVLVKMYKDNFGKNTKHNATKREIYNELFKKNLI